MKWKLLTILFLFFYSIAISQPIIIDHTCTNIDSIPMTAINRAKQALHIAYGHTSHGSQLITGMDKLDDFKGGSGLFDWNDGPKAGSLDIDDRFTGGDLGHNGDTAWAVRTRTYLSAQNHTDVNVVMWSWCGGVSDNTTKGIQTYLDKMNELEQDYPNIIFVYMTGHADIWNDANLKANNQQIRDYCRTHNKVLFDFNDIESYNPDGKYFEFVNDDCSYYDDDHGSNKLGNWAIEWQNSHNKGVDWYDCFAAHSQALNGNLKANAAWWLWSRLAGWEGTTAEISSQQKKDVNISVYPNPTTDILQVTVTNNLFNSILFIVDIPGRFVKSINTTDNTTQPVDISELENGLYFITSKQGDAVRFIKN